MKKILVIDRQGPLRGLIGLVMHGVYEVDGFSDEDRIASPEIDPPDLFVVDQRREGAHDIEFYHLIKADQRYMDVPVIVLSGGQESDEQVLAAGAEAYLRKPFSLKGLRDIINTSASGEFTIR